MIYHFVINLMMPSELIHQLTPAGSSLNSETSVHSLTLFWFLFLFPSDFQWEPEPRHPGVEVHGSAPHPLRQDLPGESHQRGPGPAPGAAGLRAGRSVHVHKHVYVNTLFIRKAGESDFMEDLKPAVHTAPSKSEFKVDQLSLENITVGPEAICLRLLGYNIRTDIKAEISCGSGCGPLALR